jgi:prepilin-type N-terminal cleavage/methylation domain-containing protein
MIRNISNQKGFTLIEMLVAGMILSIIVALAFFSMTFYLNEWEHGRMGDISAVEQYRRKQLVTAAMESAWEYYVTDPANERLNQYYPYFIGNPESVSFVTTSPVFTETDAAAARMSLRKIPDSSGRTLLYEEAPLDKFYIRYYDDKIKYPYSLGFHVNQSDLRIRYYGLDEIRFLPQQEDFEEIMQWHDRFDGKERRVMPELIAITGTSGRDQTIFRFEIRARNRQKSGLYADPY